MRDDEWLQERVWAIDVVSFAGALEEHGVVCRWRSYPRRSRLLGQYDSEKKEMSINARLRSAEVPDYVVMATIHHEACHALVSVEHDEAFRKAETLYPFWARAAAWEASADWSAILQAKST